MKNITLQVLVRKFMLIGIDKADIQKSNSHVLEVRGAGSHSVLIRLSDDRKKATVKYKGRKQVELPVTKFFHRTMVQKPRQLNRDYIHRILHLSVIEILNFMAILPKSSPSLLCE
jgi:hypothetical protein